MSYYSAPYTFDFGLDRIRVDSGTFEVDVTALYTAAKLAQASTEGILYGQVAKGSGLSDLGGGVRVGLTVELLGSWQIEFASGAYIARVTGGNLVGGPAGDPIAYSAGVQALLIQSAASTVVEVGPGGGASAPTAAENAAAVWQRAIEGGMTAEQVQRAMLAVLAGATTGAGTSRMAFKSLDGTTDRVAADVPLPGQVGNRSNVTVNGA